MGVSVKLTTPVDPYRVRRNHLWFDCPDAPPNNCMSLLKRISGNRQRLIFDYNTPQFTCMKVEPVSETKPLPPDLTRRVLKRFGLLHEPPANRQTLQCLLHQYTRIVPWESASRIVRRASHHHLEDCPAFPAAFWENALAHGTGGTCYESNYAFFSLLLRLGYQGWLTVNNMGDSIGCHSAILILLDGGKLLVDVGLPIHALLPICAAQTTVTESQFFRYAVEPLADDSYNIWRDPHPNRNAFTLIDKPIADARYRQATIRDYQPQTGLFLDALVMNKVIGERLWRFNSRGLPLHIEQFADGQRQDVPLTRDPAAQLADRFEIDRSILAAALNILGLPSD